jgi:hypothetical protein
VKVLRLPSKYSASSAATSSKAPSSRTHSARASAG